MRALLSALALAALCSAAFAQDVQVKRTSSEFDAVTNFAGPVIATRPTDLDNLLVNVQAAVDNSTKRIQWRIVLQALYQSSSWRNYQDASPPGGRTLSASPMRQVIGCQTLCQFAEVLVVPVPDDVLHDAMRNGLRLRWNAQQAGSFVSEIPASHFSAVQRAIEQ